MCVVARLARFRLDFSRTYLIDLFNCKFLHVNPIVSRCVETKELEPGVVPAAVSRPAVDLGGAVCARGGTCSLSA